MLLFNSVDGGRPVNNDDFRILQEELLKAIELQYAGNGGSFILQGCAVTGTAGDYAISAGLIFINNKVMEFDAVTGIVSFPQYIVQNADVPMDVVALEAGGSAAKRTLQKAGLVGSAPGSGESIVMTASGGRNYNDILSAQFVRLSGSQTVNGQKTFTSDVISNGLNVNSEINNINSSLTGKANKSTGVYGNDGLIGGGDLSNGDRYISLNTGGVSTVKILDGAVTNSKLANGAVDNSKLGNASVSFTKLDSSVTGLFSGNGSSSDGSVDFSVIGTYSSRTYSNKLFTLSNNTGRVRPYVRMQCQLARDSGGSDIVRLDLQRSSSPSSGFVVIATRVIKLDGDSWSSGILDYVDSGASLGSNYYRLVVTVTSGGLCYMSNNFSGTVFGVTVF